MGTEPRKVSIGDLTRACNDAAGKMGNDNPHKLLLLQCAYAMQQLVERLEISESQQGVKQ